MVQEVVWTARARADLDAIHDYIARDSPQMARVFTERLLAAGRRLRQFPLSRRSVPEVHRKDVREVMVEPYRLIYRHRTGSDVVEMTVHHGARRLRRSDIDEAKP